MDSWDEEEGPRVSKRTTKGIPPERYGDWDFPPVSPSSTIAEPIHRVPAPSTSTPFALIRSRLDLRRPVSVRSGKSGASSTKSSSSFVRIREAELRSKMKMARAEEEIEERERQREQERENAERERDKRRLQRTRDLEEMKVELERVKAEAEEDGLLTDHSQELSEDEEEVHRPNPPRAHQAPPNRPNPEPRQVRFPSQHTDTSLYMQPPTETRLHPSNPFYQPLPTEERGMTRKFLARQTIGKDLPYFSGSPEEWPCFLAEYIQTTEACGFSKVENMSRLRKCLKGKAKETVQAALAVPDNVDRVMDMLETQFGRPDLIVKTLINKAKEVPTIKEGKPEAVISFSNAVCNLSTSMELLGQTGHNSNPQLLEELMKKLPWNEQALWLTYCEDRNLKEPTITCLSSWLNGRAKAFSRCAVYESTSAPEVKIERKKGKVFTAKEAVNEEEGKLVPPASPHQAPKKPPVPGKTIESSSCSFCGAPGHQADVCRKLKKEAVSNRWEWAKTNRVCFCCLKTGHNQESCLQKSKCGKDGCPAGHHELLHQDRKSPEEKKSVPEPSLHSSDDSEVLLCVLPVKVKGPAGTVSTYALLDNGSSTTMIDSELAMEIGARGVKKPFNTQWLHDVEQSFPDSEEIEVEISGVNSGDRIFKLSRVRTVRNLALPTQTVDVEKLKSTWPHLAQIDVESMKKAQPLMLIGQRHWGIIAAGRVVHAEWSGPAATKTALGWVIHGNVPGRRQPRREFSLFSRQAEPTWSNESLHELVKESFRTESFGVMPTETLKSTEETRCVEIMERTTRRVGAEWETGLLWKSDDVQLPESKIVALKRLTLCERKMDRDPEFATFYREKVCEYLDKGFARKMTPEEAAVEGPRTWYLPHFGVIQPNKPGKIRFVFDAASKSRGVSLNDKLYKGPDLYNSLVGILWKFREKKIAFGGDIRDMFHRIKICEEDRAVQRFLWRGDRREGEPDVYEMTSMTFGATCSPASAQFVMRKNALEFKDDFPEAESAIRQHHYMDDYLDCEDTVEAAVKLIRDVCHVHQRGNFEICKFVCSSRDVLMQIPPELRADSTKDLNLESQLDTERVLGMFWDPNSDEFSFKLRIDKMNQLLDGSKIPTKREVLRVVMSLYDPLGFLANFTVHAKILLQEIWTIKIGWDDQLTEALNCKWVRWTEQLQKVTALKIPRWYGLKTGEEIQLHIFSDASEKAFSCVAYLRQEPRVTFVGAKTRVAPLKPMSIPRLELQAAVMTSRFSETIEREHSLAIGRKVFWTDSSTVLKWIRSDARRYHQFVAHRVGEILERTTIENWRWVPSSENVADEATKWTKPIDFDPGGRWITGPKFLQGPETEWPTENLEQNDVTEEDLELRPNSVFLGKTEIKPDILPDISRFSKWSRLIRATAWTIRYLQQCLPRTRKQPSPELMPEELQKAEELWTKKSQRESFPEEVKLLTGGSELRATHKLYPLSPTLDKTGVLRVQGRIDGAEGVDSRVKAPIILDPKHPYTVLLVKKYHEEAAHQGLERILNELRQHYWVIHGRQAVRRAAHNCQVCKLRRATPKAPRMGDLPDCRLEHHQRPFTRTGVDYFGPMEVTVGRRREKRYGALFTCLVTRAVHLEIAHSLSTDSFIMALRRFTGRRGFPKEIWSDNGKNFVGADRELKQALAEFDQAKLQAECSSRGIKWNFIPPRTPHMGGSWERMVKSVKQALKATLKERAPREEVLMTLFVEAEALINSHPLTHVSLDHRDDEALTPNHFLIGTSSAAPVPGAFDDDDLDLRRHWRIAQRLTDLFWKRWLKEYLPTLIRRTKWYQSREPIRVNDLVIIVDNDTPRDVWIRGIVTTVYPGRNGVVRSVEVTTNRGTYHRAVVNLIVLDVKKGSDAASKPGGSVASSTIGSEP